MNEDAIDRKLVCAFIDGLISDDGERKKALEYIRHMPPVNTQPCKDSISREWLKNAIHNFYHGLKHTPTEEDIQAYIDAAPPVNPTKTGHWEQYGNSWEDKFKCSECGKEQPKILCGERIIGHWSDYCPNCGCRMVESQERSDKE